MDREKVMQLEGRELDAAVAERVMGWDVLGEECCTYIECVWSIHPNRDCEDARAAGEVRPIYVNECSCDVQKEYYKDRIEAWSDRGDDDMVEHTKEERENNQIYGHDMYCCDVVPRFATDITDAWKIVDKLAPLFGDIDKGDGWFKLIRSDANEWQCGLDKFKTWEPSYLPVDEISDTAVEAHIQVYGQPEDGKISLGDEQVEKWSAHFHPMHPGHVDSVHETIDTSKNACAIGKTAPEAIARAAVMTTVDREPYYDER